MSEQSNPRNMVLDILLAVERDGKFLDRAVGEALGGTAGQTGEAKGRESRLTGRDRAFIRRLSRGTIERRTELDYILDQFSDTKTEKMKPVIRAILESGVFQLLYMDSVPDSAVCNEAVRLARQRGFSGLTGYVNGVLRNIARNRDRIGFPSGEEDPVRSLSVRYSMPEWIVKRYIASFGDDRCERILAAYLKERPLSVRVDTRTHTPEEAEASLKAQGIRVSTDPRLPYAFYLEGMDSLQDIPEFADGTLYPQDISSMFAVETADPRPGDLVLDVCAAPGGKSIHAAQRMDRGKPKDAPGGTCPARAGGTVTARDKTEPKVDLIRENALRCHTPNVCAEVWDALTFDPAWEDRADLVMADLPCSGLGVIGHKPDLKYRVTEEDVRELAMLQREILAVAVRYVKPGGTLLYSTCTMTEEENGENTRRLLELYPGFSLAEERQLLPDEGCDGFYIAKLRRTGKKEC